MSYFNLIINGFIFFLEGAIFNPKKQKAHIEHTTAIEVKDKTSLTSTIGQITVFQGRLNNKNKVIY